MRILYLEHHSLPANHPLAFIASATKLRKHYIKKKKEIKSNQMAQEHLMV